MEKIRLPIIIEEMCIYTGAREVELTRKEYERLTRKFGLYKFDWYFVSPTTIKYWDGKQWNYTRR